MKIFGKNLYLNLTFVLCIMTFLLCSCKMSYKCCDQLNNATVNTDCTCSDQTGGVGTCSCKTSPNIRKGWLCKKDANGDSVNIILNKVLFFFIQYLLLIKVSMLP